MGFQKGDLHIVIDQKTYGLRLTLGALAEINSRLSVAGPQALAKRLRSLSPADGRVLLACVMRPCLPSEDAQRRSVAKLSDAEIGIFLPVICELLSRFFLMENDADWPFEAWLKIAVMQFGLPPKNFWDMSLVDWFSLTRMRAPDVMGLEDLMKMERDYELVK